jgi:hypothetical protein
MGGFVAQCVASEGVFQLGDRAQVARVHFRHFGSRFSLHRLDVLETFRCIAAEIQDVPHRS